MTLGDTIHQNLEFGKAIRPLLQSQSHISRRQEGVVTIFSAVFPSHSCKFSSLSCKSEEELTQANKLGFVPLET